MTSMKKQLSPKALDHSKKYCLILGVSGSFL